jgi:2-polyprenyl-3-methyl-5-hydroxy-6-metoxy-1,4-benzoquinol methylase
MARQMEATMNDSFDQTDATDKELLERFRTEEPAQLRPWIEARICENINVETRIVDLFYRVFYPKAATPPAQDYLRVSESIAASLKYTYEWLPTFHNSVRFLDAYYRDTPRLRREYDARVQFLVRYIKGLNGLVPGSGYALDFGAGDGQMIAGLVTEGVRWIAVEQSSVARELLRNREYPAGMTPTIMSQLESVEVTAFDLIIATDVIEHILDPMPVLLQLADLLRPEGRMFISVPNGRVDRHIGHLHFFTSQTLRYLLDQLVERFGKSHHTKRVLVDLVDYHRAGIAALIRRI